VHRYHALALSSSFGIDGDRDPVCVPVERFMAMQDAIVRRCADRTRPIAC